MNATSPLPGTYTYTPPAGTILPVGTQTLTVTFTPADTVNYTSATKTVTIEVLAATRVIGLSGDLAFGSLAVNTTPMRLLTIGNTGNSVLTVTGITYPAGFSGAWTGTIQPGGTQAVAVRFAPTAVTTYGGTVSVMSNATSGTSTIAASGTGVTTGLPDLVVSALTGPATATPGGSLTLADTTRNQGPGAAAASETRFFWSTNSTYDAADVALGSRAVPALAAAASSGPVSTTLTVPAGAGTGSYYVLAVADGAGAIAESSETNNKKSLGVRISVTSGPDLIVSALTGPAATVPGATLTLLETTKNQGTLAAGPTATTLVWSTNTTYDPADVPLGTRSVPALTAGASSGPVARAVTVPAGLGTGTYYVLAVADATSGVAETLETNNRKYLAVTIGPDLIVSAFTGPSTVAPGSRTTFSATTKNQGLIAAGTSVTKFFWSTDAVYDASDVDLGSLYVPALAAGESYGPIIKDLMAPAGAGVGTYYIIAVADATGLLTEASETNNRRYLIVKIAPDLIVSALTGPALVTPGAAITLSDTTKNQGAVAADASVTRFYWSTNTTLDAGDLGLGSRSVPALAGLASSGPVATGVTVPAGAGVGTYYVIAVADGTGLVAEASETNNRRTLTVKIGPDLIVSALTASSTVAPGASLTISDTTKNQGSFAAGASVTRFVLSTNTTVDAADTVLGSRSVEALAASASSGPASTVVTVPPGTTPGTYYLIAVADGDAAVAETSETNNTRARAITVSFPPPTISQVAPASGPITGGTSVTIRGTGFFAGATVTFGGVLASGVVVVDSSTATAIAPAASREGSVDVTLPAQAGSGTLRGAFPYLSVGPLRSLRDRSGGERL